MGAIAAAGVLVGIAPAEAGSRILCTGFIQCELRGRSDGGYALNRLTSFWNAASGTNCTNYVAYRLTHGGRRTARPPGTNAASTWGKAARDAGIPVTGTPQVGAIAWWASNVYPSKKKGHVAYVEAVRKDGSIIVSEDNMNHAFSWRKVTKGRGWPSGFIHFPRSDGSPFGAVTSMKSDDGRLDFWFSASDPDAFNKALRYEVIVDDHDDETKDDSWTFTSDVFVNHRIRTVQARGKVTVTVVAHNRKKTAGKPKVVLGARTVTVKD